MQKVLTLDGNPGYEVKTPLINVCVSWGQRYDLGEEPRFLTLGSCCLSINVGSFHIAFYDGVFR